MIERYEHGDDGYDDLWDKWVEEGSPGRFEEIGTFGGRQWKAINYSNETYPQFVLVAADGPTELDTTDDMEYSGRETKQGYGRTMPKHGGMTVSVSGAGKISIGYDERPFEDD
jgi:hypothetical protein